MTPLALAKLVATQLGDCDTVLDLAVGDGALLKAVTSRLRSPVNAIGFDIDCEMIALAHDRVPNARLRASDGMRARIFGQQITGALGIVGNPPFGDGTQEGLKWVRAAFPRLKGKLAAQRAEVQFLARSLVLARKYEARVVMILPMSFADGDAYSGVREALIEDYSVIKSIEVAGQPFSSTEARTFVLVVDPFSGLQRSTLTSVCEWDAQNLRTTTVLRKKLSPGERFDARYHRAMRITGRKDILQLQDLDVEINRGQFSKKEAARLQIDALHTSHWSLANNGRLCASSHFDSTTGINCVTARKGDILLPRTGTRVLWAPMLVQKGEAAITDHVFRIRAPRAVREIVHASFLHPSFPEWLAGISKGVCATVLTKRELLQMPVFAWPE